MKMKHQFKKSLLALTALIMLVGTLILPGQAVLTHADEADAGGTRAEAKEIHLDQTYSESLASGDDVDFFKFTTTKSGYFQVEFAHNAADSNKIVDMYGWKVCVLDEKGEELTSASKITQNWTSMILPYAKAGRTFYVQVLSPNGQWGPINCVYDLTVKQTETAEWEAEPNGTMAEATVIQTGREYNGITLSSKDDDYYKLDVPAAGKLKVQLSASITNPSDSVRRGWSIHVYDKTTKEEAKLTGITTENSISFDVKKGTYYIRIEPNAGYTPLGCRYSISTVYAKTPSKPKISSVKAAKKAATVKWEKVSGASGYYIYRSTSKTTGYKKVKTINKASVVSWKNTELKSQGKYYYKVAAYKTVSGMTVVSSNSEPKSVKVK